MKNIIKITLAVIAVLVNVSCGTAGGPRRGGYSYPQEPAVSSGYGHQMNSHTEQRFETPRRPQDAKRKIIEHGTVGRWRQEFDAEGNPVGKPFWVPGSKDAETYNGLPVHTMKHTRMSSSNLKQMLQQFGDQSADNGFN